MKGNLCVDTDSQMGAHYDFIAECINRTAEEVIPAKKPMRRNGRDVSEKTKDLYRQRVRDFNSGRKITKSDRKAWNRTLAQAGKDDFEAWYNDMSR